MIDIGSSVGNYVVRSKLGEGGMGIVYLAEHPLIGRRVAIKVIHPNYARNPEAVSRFFTEAQAVNRIGHPNIVDITDFGQSADGDSYFIMEFLSGESLAARLHKGPMPLATSLYVGMQVADALAASHASGILHRDLKPDNVYLIARGGDPNVVKVLDFGLAKLTGGGDKSSHKTRTGSVMGTPYYMAPEQCAGKSDIDARADVYALGVMLYEMIVGTVPFGGEGYGEIIVKHMTQPAPSAAVANPSVPRWLDELLLRTLAKDRQERVQSMEEVRDTLASHLGELQAAGTAGGIGPQGIGIHAGRPASVTPLPRGPGQVTPYPPPIAGAGASATGGVTKPPSQPPTRLGVGGGPTPMPGVLTPQFVSQVPSPAPAAPISTMGLSAGESGAVDSTPAKKSKTLWIVGAIAVAGVAVGVVVLKGNGGAKSAASSTASTTPAPTTPAPSPPALPQPAPTQVTVTIVSDPAGADVIDDHGAVLGKTPFEWKHERGDTPVSFTLKKDGYEPKVRPVAPDASREIDVDLTAQPVAAKVPPPTAPPVTPPSQTPHHGGAKPADKSTDKPADKPAKKPGDDTEILAPSFDGK